MQNQYQNSKTDIKYRTFYLSINIIKYLDSLAFKISTKIIIDQLVRCSTSIGANVVEARGSSSKREFLNFFQIALKSAQESKYWLAMLKELIPEDVSKIDVFLKETDEITKILSSSVLTMKGKRSI